MKKRTFEKETDISLELVRKAVFATERIRLLGPQVGTKPDGSPVTPADLVSQSIILGGIRRHFPGDKVIAEEQVNPDGGESLGDMVFQVLREMGLPDDRRSLEETVNYRGKPDGARTWMVDPLDGTKGYVRGLCYSIALGLFEENKPCFGCIASPLFPEGAEDEPVIVYGMAGQAAYRIRDQGNVPQKIGVSDTERIAQMRIVGSRAHDSEDFCGSVANALGIADIHRMDGEAKYLMLALGLAEIYVRTSKPSLGIGYPWDHCAGQAILEAAGGKVTDLTGKMIDYGDHPQGRMTGVDGLAATNGKRHEEILDRIRDLEIGGIHNGRTRHTPRQPRS